MARGRLTAEYELASMNRQITELAQAETFARAQQTAAEARAAAARAMAMAAGQRTEAAAANLAAFDDQTFTADVWAELAGFMRHISRLQLYRGTRIARLMQQAYNFENDVNRRIIRADYTTAGAAGLLGADALARDIDAFTFDLVTTRRQKEMPLTYTLSLAGMFPFLFETTFRNTGTISFQTRIEDIDRIAPGTYARRIERVEVAVEGLLPRGGARGVLTNGGISFYRTQRIDDVRVRVQPSESLILSEHDLRRDALIFRNDERTRGIFEGAGIASTWTLELPKVVNDLNYETITDVRITFYAMARYHSALALAVQNQLSTVPGLLRRTRTLPLRWLHPDAFFRFQDTGRLEFALTPVDDFGFDEQDPQIVQVGVLFKTVAGTDPTSWQVRLVTPEHGESPAASPNAAGEITVEVGHPWEDAANGAALGEWAIVLRLEENAPLVSDGRLDLSAVQNTVLLLDYTYTARA